ncbi:hypothetical protein PIB30_045409 [Stylosanthes scabra]|uniref:Uncharacterized protein n=1 Tax=Stylosanthes scabra TaxID=79078 RepID=A0ABU6YIJ4_9FABA|nr:hypothetical protein [Stylosanthes scabra]
MIERSTCFGFVTMSSVKEAEAAKLQIDGYVKQSLCIDCMRVLSDKQVELLNMLIGTLNSHTDKNKHTNKTSNGSLFKVFDS